VRLIPLGAAAIAAALYLGGLGAAPFVDPPEGFHVAVARAMVEGGDWITPRLNGVRYFDKPPLLYWLMAGAFRVAGPAPFTARFWPALAAVGCAAVTARLGVLLGGPRVGLLAGLMVVANLGMFLFGRIVKPDTAFILCITLAYAGFAAAWLGRGGRRGLVLFYGALGLATLTKDVLGAVGPLVAVAVFLRVTRERPVAPWWPAWGVGLFAAVAVPWYVAVEASNPGFLWYTVVDNHLLNFVRQRVFPDEDVPLTALEFVAVTAGAFLPWSLAAPWAVARALRRPWATAVDRLWVLLAVWALLVIGFFTVSPFKLPHYGLPAFPALALLVARTWDDAIALRPDRVGARTLLVPVAALFAVVALAFAAARLGALPVPREVLTAVDVTTRNLAAHGQPATTGGPDVFGRVLTLSATIFGAAALLVAAAARRRAAEPGLIVALGAVLAFLPVAGTGMAQFARLRSAEPIARALAERVGPADAVVHEGALENSASVLLALRRPVHVVHGLVSNLAFGATFPDAADAFWTPEQVRRAWSGPGRTFLVSVVRPDASVVQSLPPESVHLLTEAAGRRLYSNRPDPPAPPPGGALERAGPAASSAGQAGGGEARIHPGHRVADPRAEDRQLLGGRRRRLPHVGPVVDGEAGPALQLGPGDAGMEALDRERAALPHEAEDAERGDHLPGPARADHVGRGGAGRGDVVHALDEDAGRVLGAEHDHPARQVVEHGGAGAAGQPDARAVGVADGDQIQVAVAVDLAAGEEEEVEAAALGEVVELLGAGPEGPVVGMVEDDDPGPGRAGEVGEQHPAGGHRGQGADRHRLAVPHLAGDGGGHQLLDGPAHPSAAR